MGAIYVKRLILSVALIIPIASNASDALNQPSSSLNDGVETFLFPALICLRKQLLIWTLVREFS